MHKLGVGQDENYENKKRKLVSNLANSVDKAKRMSVLNSFLELHEKHFESPDNYHKALEKHSSNIRYEVGN